MPASGSEMSVPDKLQEVLGRPLNLELNASPTHWAGRAGPAGFHGTLLGSQRDLDGLSADPTHEAVLVERVVAGGRKYVQFTVHLRPVD